MLTISESDSGIIAMMFENAKDDYVTEIALETVCQYYMLPDKIRKMKSRKSVVESVLTANQIDLDFSISTKEYYESLIGCLTDNILVAEAQAEEEKYQTQFDNFFEYLKSAESFFDFTKKMLESWEIKESELYSASVRKDYCNRLKDLKMFVLGTSMPGKQFFITLENLDSFIQNIVSLLPREEFTKYWNEIKPNSSLEWLNVTEDGLIESEGKYSTISDEVRNQWAKYCTQDIDVFSALTEERIRNNVTEDYYNIANLSQMFSETYITGCLLTAGKVYFSILSDYLKKYIDEPSNKYEKLFSLYEKYPISFDTNEYSNLVRIIEDKVPYISFEYKDLMGEHNDSNQTSFWMSDDSKRITIKIHFNNMEKLGTVHYSILENSYFDSDSFEEYEKFEVQWGKWGDNSTCEIKFKKLSDELGSFKVKVWADCDPDCVGIIEGM